MKRLRSKNKNNDNNNKNKSAQDVDCEKTSEEIDQYLQKLELKNQQTITALLLGTGGSGKSVILKQMEKLYDTTFNNKLINKSKYIQEKLLNDIYNTSKQNNQLKVTYPKCELSENLRSH